MLYYYVRQGRSETGRASHRKRPYLGIMHNTAINNLYKLTNKIIKKNPKKVLTNHFSSGIISTERKREVNNNDKENNDRYND